MAAALGRVRAVSGQLDAFIIAFTSYANNGIIFQ